MPTVTPS